MAVTSESRLRSCSRPPKTLRMHIVDELALIGSHDALIDTLTQPHLDIRSPEVDAGATPISNEPKPRILLMGLRRLGLKHSTHFIFQERQIIDPEGCLPQDGSQRDTLS